MTTRTLTALFDSRDSAEGVRRNLIQFGAGDDAVQIVEQRDREALSSDDHQGFWESLKDLFVADEDRSAYAEGLRRGGYLLTAGVDEEYADEAVALIEGSDAIDLESRSRDWQADGWTSYQPNTTASSASASTASGAASDTTERSIPIVEERVRIGKRESDRGGVRVRSYVVEKPATSPTTPAPPAD